jgi:hypothetical protein
MAELRTNAPIITVIPQKVTLPTGVKVLPIDGTKLGPGKGNQGRGGAYGHMQSRWKEIKK